MKRPKITVIGSGPVGIVTCQRLAESSLGDLVMLTVPDREVSEEGAGRSQSLSAFHHDVQMAVSDDVHVTVDSDIIVVTAGLEECDSVGRVDLQETNTANVAGSLQRAVRSSRDAILIMVAGPQEVMCEVARRVSGFPRERVIGLAGSLTASRMRAHIAAELGVSRENVFAQVLGGYGGTLVPLPRYSTVSGVPLPEVLPRERIDAIVRRTTLNNGETARGFDAEFGLFNLAAGIHEMADSIINDRKRILSCAVYLQGEFGLRDVWVGVPARLGISGMEGVFELRLTEDELALLHSSAAEVAARIARLPDDLEFLGRGR